MADLRSFVADLAGVDGDAEVAIDDGGLTLEIRLTPDAEPLLHYEIGGWPQDADD